jgi:hypothetical protein
MTDVEYPENCRREGIKCAKYIQPASNAVYAPSRHAITCTSKTPHHTFATLTTKPDHTKTNPSQHASLRQTRLSVSDNAVIPAVRPIPEGDTSKVSKAIPLNLLRLRLHIRGLATKIGPGGDARSLKSRSTDVEPALWVQAGLLERLAPQLDVGLEAGGADLAAWVVVELDEDEVGQEDGALGVGGVWEGTLWCGRQVVLLGWRGVVLGAEDLGEGVPVGGVAVLIVCIWLV